MARYVDRLIDYTGRVPYRHKVWCHLVADTDEELHAAAADLGLPDVLLQGGRGWDTHLDLPAPLRPDAVAAGAVEVDFRFMGQRTRARRAALALGADVAVGAPAGTVIEFPLPVDLALDGALGPVLVMIEGSLGPHAITRTMGEVGAHPLFPDQAVLSLSPSALRQPSSEPLQAIVTVPRDGRELRIGAVWSPVARQDRR